MPKIHRWQCIRKSYFPSTISFDRLEGSHRLAVVAPVIWWVPVRFRCYFSRLPPDTAELVRTGVKTKPTYSPVHVTPITFPEVWSEYSSIHFFRFENPKCHFVPFSACCFIYLSPQVCLSAFRLGCLGYTTVHKKMFRKKKKHGKERATEAGSYRWRHEMNAFALSRVHDFEFLSCCIVVTSSMMVSTTISIRILGIE